ncbi:lytic transglycosylase domain-containing protein [Sandaracinus amylolyticus]|uniref:lytic transglycosylase domain-containing protein n=1 Tax=Sandaracinus amylolyticus TaxID=927083 RepID=UPI001F28C72D|nr:lytic transglycosylase domain-containing protein [Sandaracinus amylolyticus]UJR81853.1 Soluble lytic murein transglycosylase [Sandaracinus amylolyticus]
MSLASILLIGGSTVPASAWDGPMCASDGVSMWGVSTEGAATWSEAAMAPASRFSDASLTSWPRDGEPAVLACLPGTPAYTGGTPAYTGLSSPASAAPTVDARFDAARRAYASLAAHRAAARDADALISLATLRELVPELSDRWDLIEGEMRPADRRGCEAYERAASSPHAAVAARGRVGRVRCLLEVRDRRADVELRALLARYPELPEALDLRLLEAEMREGRGDVRGAIAILRDIDLTSPDMPAAERARASVARLEASGHRIPPFTPLQIVERLDRIVRRGAPDFARAEIERVQSMRLPRRELAEVTLLAARIARVEGRFEDAAQLMRQARGATDDADIRAQAEDLAAAAVAHAEGEARAELARFTGRARTLRTVNTTRLFGYLRTATRAGLRPEVDGALDELATRSLPCGLRLEAGVLASGAGDDERVARVLEQCVNAPGSIGVASRYHRARALERLGRHDVARAELAQVIAQDRTETRWYALWARQWLGGEPVASAATTSALEPGKTREHEGDAPEPTLVVDAPSPRGTAVAPQPAPSPTVASDEEDLDVPVDAPAPRFRPMPRDEIEQRLAVLAETHRAGYPWLTRALAMLRLGDDAGVTDELHEAFLAWYQARGRGTLRAGVEAVYRGATPPRMRAESGEAMRARRQLGAVDAGVLGDIAASLGDFGLAIRFGGRSRAAMRPRAYEQIVNEVARERGLDPNLLLAVMRVESVYNPRIVSYAGAVGLLQIMPRTGRLIARSMGREAQFGVDDLLDPRTNIEFAAWYLSSLIRRFEGRVPLAVASYNGGPHNVRRWLRDHSEDMPIDAFCERIPFDQTHRYVRRVLGHWAAYRAQQGLPMVELDPSIPELEADRVAF